jgi:hypothetical protein
LFKRRKMPRGVCHLVSFFSFHPYIYYCEMPKSRNRQLDVLPKKENRRGTVMCTQKEHNIREPSESCEIVKVE